MYIAVNIFHYVCMCVRACRRESERESASDFTTAIGLIGLSTVSFAIIPADLWCHMVV